ncbi:LGFP repeat-containing protein, partial [Paenarthrobacter sp. 22069]|uniref:LGFP repeat-containing protein n=1 Tax=Paenarthrobacter sp. 22069 TaxID=3453864 RepID=UPI003F87EE9E
GLKDGGVFQNYQGGAIIWSPATGAHISIGAIRSLWAATGFENGKLGYPVTNEVGGLKDGGVYQNYQGGAIIWSPATGAHVSLGAIRSIWASTGYESGRLGYPTSDEYATGGDGGVAQNYQGGVIHVSRTGSYITWF